MCKLFRILKQNKKIKPKILIVTIGKEENKNQKLQKKVWNCDRNAIETISETMQFFFHWSQFRTACAFVQNLHFGLARHTHTQSFLNKW